MNSKHWMWPAAAVMSFGLAGCFGGGGSDSSSDADTSDAMPAAVTAACSGLIYTASPVAPLDDIEIFAIQPALGEHLDEDAFAYGRIFLDGEDLGGMPVRLDPDWDPEEGPVERLLMPAPIHPESPFMGGEIQVALVVEDWTCAAQTVTLAPLPRVAEPAQELEGMRDALAAWLEQTARVFGVADLDALVARQKDWVESVEDEEDIGNESGTVIALFAAHDQLIVLDLVLAHYADDEPGLELAASVMAQVTDIGFTGSLQELNLALGDIDPFATGDPEAPDPAMDPAHLNTTHVGTASDTPWDTSTATVDPYARLAESPPQQIMTAGTAQGCGFETSTRYAINDAESLNRAMRFQRETQNRAESTGRAALDYASVALPAVGLLGGPVGAAAGTIAGGTLMLYSIMEDITVNTLPSRLTSLSVDLNPGAVIPEDYHTSPSSPARWSNAELSAASNGMSLAGTAFQIALKGFGGAKFLARSPGARTSADLNNMRPNTVQQDIDSILKANDDVVKGFATTVFSDVLSSQFDCFRIAPASWSGIDVSRSRWLKTESVFGKFTLDPANTFTGGQNIHLAETGDDILRLDTLEDQFGGRQQSLSQSLSIIEARLVPTPSVVYVEEIGSIIDVDTRVRPQGIITPEKTTFARTDAPGASLIGGEEMTWVPAEAVHRVSLQTPSDEALYPFMVDFRQPNLIKGGTGETTRRASVQVRADEGISVTPPAACISPGESLTVTAEVGGVASIDGNSIDWDNNGGALQVNDPVGLTQQAIFTAPASGAGSGFVRATLVNSDAFFNSDRTWIAWGSCDAVTTANGQLRVGGQSQGTIETQFADFDIFNSRLQTLEARIEKPPLNLLWRGRSEYLGGNGNNSFEVDVRCNQVSADGKSCLDTVRGTLQATGSANSMLSSDGSSNMNFSFNQLGSRQCLRSVMPSSGGTRDIVKCSESDAHYIQPIHFHFDIEQFRFKRLVLELECQTTGSAMAGMGVVVQALRQSPGDAFHLPFFGYRSIEEVFEAEMEGRITAGQRQAIIEGRFVDIHLDPCSHPTGSVTFNIAFPVASAVTPGTPDLGELRLFMIATGVTAPYSPGNITMDMREAYSAAVKSLLSLDFSPPNVGSGFGTVNEGNYQGSVSIKGKVQLLNLTGD